MGNSRELPKYERTAALQPNPQADLESAPNAMINAFKNFSSSVNQVTTKITDDEAKSRREIIKNNIDNTYKQFSLEALKNPDQNAALANFKKSSEMYAKGMHAETDSYNRPYVNNLVDYYHNEHLYQIEKNAILQNKRMQEVEANERLGNATQGWMTAVQNSTPMVDEDGNDVQFNNAKALFATTINNAKQDTKTGAISPEKFASFEKEQLKNFTEEMFLKRYEDHVRAGRGNEYLKELQDVDFHVPGYSEDDKRIMISKMIKIRDQNHKSAKLAMGQYKRDITHEIAAVTKGATPNQVLLDEVTAINENAGADLKYRTEVAQSVYANTQAVLHKTPEGVEQFKREMRPTDFNAPDYGKRLDIYNDSVKAIDAQQEEFKANPMVITMQDKGIQEVVNNYQQAFNANAATSDNKYSPFNTSVPKPWDYVIDSQLHGGMTLNGSGAKNGKPGTRVRLLDEKDTTGMVNDIMTADPHDAIMYMNKLRDQYGEGLPYNLVMKQLVDAGLPADYSLMNNIDPDSVDALQTMQALKLEPEILSQQLAKMGDKVPSTIAKRSERDVFGIAGTGTPNFKAFVSTLTKHTGDADAEYMAGIQHTVQKIAGYYTLTQGLDPSAAVAKAEDIIANRYSYTSIGNSKVRIPKTLPANTVKEFADKMQDGVSSFPFNMEGSDKARAKIAIEHGHWRNDNVDHGMVWVDANDVMWTDKNGHPYSFSFDEAKTGVLQDRNPQVSGVTHAGMLMPGNIDLDNRPEVKNADGTHSTVDTITIERNGKTILIPQIVGGKRLSKEEAIKHYKDTNEHMGVFRDQASADAYDKELHEEKGWNGAGNKWATAEGEVDTGIMPDQLDQIDIKGAQLLKRGKKMGAQVHKLLADASKGKL